MSTSVESPIWSYRRTADGDLELLKGGHPTCIVGCMDHDPSVGIFGDPAGCVETMEEIVRTLNAVYELAENKS